MIPLTSAQKQAVRSQGRRILVEAGAGSGKTRVLVERIAYLIEERGVAADEILALTFTDQATCEMKNRLSQRLQQELHAVLTFHRFCGRVLRENPLAADVDPDFSMLDGARSKQVQRDILLRLVRDSTVHALERLLEYMGDEPLVQAMLAMYERSRQLRLSPDSLAERTEQRLERLREEHWKIWRETVEQLIELHLENRIQAPGTKQRLQSIMNAWQQLPLALRESSPDGWEETSVLELKAVAEAIFKQVSGAVAQEAKPLFARLAALKKDRLWEDLLFDPTREFRASLQRLLADLDEQYTLYKSERGFCDFNDLESRAYRLFDEHEELRRHYGQMYRHVLVDEYQDTSPLQQAILDLLLAGRGEQAGSLFLVGDPRQSIYRFRGANVSGFLKARETLGEQDEHVELLENFRMNDSLCAWTQTVCGGLFEQEMRAAEEESPEALVVVELLVPVIDKNANKQDREADLLARRILQFGPGQFGEIAILLQTRTLQSVYQRALQRYGIPFVIVEDTGFWKRQEVQDLLHLLHVLVDPEDALVLLGFLKSPLVGCSDALLWKIAQPAGLAAGFWEEMHGGLAPEEQRYIDEVKQRIAKWRQDVNQLGVADWLYDLLYGQGVEAMLGGGGLKVFVEWAEEAEVNGVTHLSDLLTEWRQREESGERVGREGDRTSTGCQGGQVRIMTIHAAKGLEFPIVCLPDLTHPQSIRMETLHLCDKQGLTMKRYDPSARAWLPTLAYAAAAESERSAEAEEKRRLFYVGITRAQERVILSGSASAFTAKSSLAECSNWWDWLPHLLPELREELLGSRMLHGRGWKMQVILDESVPVDVGLAEKTNATRGQTFEDAERLEDEKWIAETGAFASARPLAVKRIWGVTELVKRAAGENLAAISFRRGGFNGFGQADELQAFEWGNVVHKLFEHLRFDDTEATIRDVRLPMALAACGFAGLGRVDAVWEQVRELVRKYWACDLFREYQAARVRHHELPFVLELLPGLPVSGVIDAVWLREDGGATVVDFKTQPCRTEQEMQAAAERYAPQVRLYAHAVERLLGWSVDRVGIYLTHVGRYLEVDAGKGDVRWLAEGVGMGKVDG